MRVALFVPCYVDQLGPDVAWAALELLEKLGLDVDVPDAQTCCGQPLINTGASAAAEPLAHNFDALIRDYEHVVSPSGSCVATLRQHGRWFGERARPRVYELSEFLLDVLGAASFDVEFPFRVALHQSCHALRELGLGAASELAALPVEQRAQDRARTLLAGVRGLNLVEPARVDECCGFGGGFCIAEADVSARMGQDRVEDFAQAGAEVITSTDLSCLLHLDGVLRRQGRNIAVMHLAQILAGRKPCTL